MRSAVAKFGIAPTLRMQSLVLGEIWKLICESLCILTVLYVPRVSVRVPSASLSLLSKTHLATLVAHPEAQLQMFLRGCTLTMGSVLFVMMVIAYLCFLTHLLMRIPSLIPSVALSVLLYRVLE